MKYILGFFIGFLFFLIFIIVPVVNNYNKTMIKFFDDETQEMEKIFKTVIDSIMEYDKVYVPPSRLLGIFVNINKEYTKEDVIEVAQKGYVCVINYYEMKKIIPDGYYDENGKFIQPEAYEEKVHVDTILDNPTKLSVDIIGNIKGEKWKPDAKIKYIQERECVFKDDDTFVEDVIRNHVLKDMLEGNEKEKTIINIASSIGFYLGLDEDIVSNWGYIKNILDNLNMDDLNNIIASEGWIRPINGGRVSAGTWYYPANFGSGIHLGIDYAAPIGTSIFAAGNGVILASFDGCENNGGIGNMCGAGGSPGGGNQVYLLTNINNTLYVVKYIHMSKGTPVLTGSIVNAGDVIGQVGKSGNTTGPHVHVEIFNLGNDNINDFINRWNGDLSFGTGYKEKGLQNLCSLKGSPCREKPESKFGSN
ncbi:MAG: M23 family metallopeptidase [Erysipelotrichaceae bacterium]|nr:M23 family metallopeptidase [Erysipelotrichaceae bacterium]